MNILLVSSEFPLSDNQATGGIGTYLLNLTKGLINQGHKVTVITKGYGVNKHKGVNVIFCNFGMTFIERVKKTLSLPLFKRFLNFIEYPILFSLESFIKINQLSKRQKIDIIEGNDFGGELFFYLLFNPNSIPVVLRLHTPSFVIKNFNNESLTLFYRLMKLFEIFCLKRANSLYSPSKSLARVISKEIGKPVQIIIPYPFKPLFTTKKIKRNRNLILYAGKLQVKKGVFHLIEAVPKVIYRFPKTKFMFVGPDTLFQGKSVRNMLIDYTLKNKLTKNVFIQKETTKEEIYKYYQKALITVIPSVWENFPNVCLEAMSNGSCVVANKVGGLREMITDKTNGVLVDVHNSKMFRQRIIDLLKDNKLINKLSTNGIKTVQKNYDLSKILGQTINYYQKCIDLFYSRR